MSITLDFLLLFLLFVIPGFVFKRIYYFGEFSKQFNIQDPIYKVVFFSVIPGIFFQIFGYLIYWFFHSEEISFYTVLSVFRDISTNPVIEFQTSTNTFLNQYIHYFFIHQFNVNVLAAFFGFILSKGIRAFKLDRKSKIFRFGNQWYYIFSGDIQSFRKFKLFNNNLAALKPIISNDLDKASAIPTINDYSYYPPLIDVLISNSASGGNFYTGYVIDYDLNPKDIHSLDKIYLKYPYRYRGIRENDDLEKFEVKGSKVKIPIEGDFLVLNASEIRSMNVTYIPSPDDYLRSKNKTKTLFLKIIYIVGLIFNTLLFLEIIFLKGEYSKYILPNYISNSIINDFNVFMRVIVAMGLNLIVALFLPVYKYNKLDKEISEITYKDSSVLIAKIVLLVICVILFLIFE